MPDRVSPKNMPGWIWEYRAGHGFNGRHGYNPNTGEALSVRQTAAVRDGKQSLQAALARAVVPRATHLARWPKNKPKTWRVRTFNSIYGAVRYAALRGNFAPDRAIHITAYGYVAKPYPGENKLSYRTISAYGDRSYFAASRTIFEIYRRFEQQFDAPYKVPTYYVWEAY